MGRPDNQFAIQFEIAESLLPSINRDFMVNRVLNAIEKELNITVNFWERVGIKIRIMGLNPTEKTERVFVPYATGNITLTPIEKDQIVRYYLCEP